MSSHGTRPAEANRETPGGAHPHGQHAHRHDGREAGAVTDPVCGMRVDPATALRAAQLSLVRHADPDRRHASAWGAFVVVGGAATRSREDERSYRPWTSP